MSPTISVENSVVNDVISVLETIGDSGTDYYSSPARVYRMYGSTFELSELPSIIVTPLTSPQSHNCPNGLERIDLKLAITCVMDAYADGALGEDFSTLELDVRNMATDVRTALQADLKRGGLAIDTIVDSVDIFEATQMNPVAAAEVTVTIPFRHQTADPTQPL